MANSSKIAGGGLPAWSIGPGQRPLGPSASTAPSAPTTSTTPQQFPTQRTRGGASIASGNTSSAPSTPATARPCPTCSSLIAWLDAYGAVHCPTCDPVPFARLSFCKSVVAVAPRWWVERVVDLRLALPGFPASLTAPASRGRDVGGGIIEGGGRTTGDEAVEVAEWQQIILDVPKDAAASLVLFTGDEGDELFDEVDGDGRPMSSRWWGLWSRWWRRVPISEKERGEIGSRAAVVGVGKILERDGSMNDVAASRVEVIFERWK